MRARELTLSSPIIISSMVSHRPNLTKLGLSKVLAISPPLTSANRSTPSKSACSMHMMPASAKRDSG